PASGPPCGSVSARRSRLPGSKFGAWWYRRKTVPPRRAGRAATSPEARMPARITTTLYTDPACPWAYSESPPLRVLEWRYGAQLDWRLVVIGLTEQAQQYLDRGYTPLRAARGQARFRRYGMPFAPTPKARVAATARACRAIVAARLTEPGSEWRALRA